MVKSKYYLLGYREISVGEQIGDFVARLMKAKIPFEAVRGEKIIVFERDFEEFKRIFKSGGYEASEALGFNGLLRRVKHKWAFVISSIIGVVLIFLSSSVVWDVRISGNKAIPETVIVEGLSACGFSVGTLWGGASLSDVEYDMLDKFDEISWININHVGTVAFVEILESELGYEGEKSEVGYANIVADRDCIIEEITVSVGYPLVKVGDAVRRGEILIMGVENNELGRLTCAEGQVIGRAYDSVSTAVGRIKTKREKKYESVLSISIKIFDFSINLFKKYGNLDTECDIIESKRRITLFGKLKLPLEISTKSAVFYEVKSESYNDGELVSVCSARHRQMLKSVLVDRDLSKITTTGEFSGDEYKIVSDIVYSTEVGVLSPMGEE